MTLRAAWTALLARRSASAEPPRGRPKAPPRPRMHGGTVYSPPPVDRDERGNPSPQPPEYADLGGGCILWTPGGAKTPPPVGQGERGTPAPVAPEPLDAFTLRDIQDPGLWELEDFDDYVDRLPGKHKRVFRALIDKAEEAIEYAGELEAERDGK